MILSLEFEEMGQVTGFPLMLSLFLVRIEMLMTFLAVTVMLLTNMHFPFSVCSQVKVFQFIFFDLYKIIIFITLFGVFFSVF